MSIDDRDETIASLRALLKNKEHELADLRRDLSRSVGRLEFANPGSALRAASSFNPRNLPCPTCHADDNEVARVLAATVHPYKLTAGGSIEE